MLRSGFKTPAHKWSGEGESPDEPLFFAPSASAWYGPVFSERRFETTSKRGCGIFKRRNHQE